MSESTVDVHKARLEEVIPQYEAEGYRVCVHPDERQLPAFLEGYRPDAIAERDGSSVVIHVASRADLKGDEQLPAIVRTINEQSGWRLDLVTVGDQETLDYSDLPSTKALQSKSRSVVLLREEGYEEEAFLVCWTLAEALLRHLALQNDVDLDDLHPGDVVKRLYMYGVIEESMMDELIDAVRVRNRLVHGMTIEGNVPMQSLMETTNVLYRRVNEASDAVLFSENESGI